MSRIAKQPIPLPAGVTANLGAGELLVKGPLGTLARRFRDDVKITIGDEGIVVAPAHSSILANALSGTYASHIRNMILGVTKGFEKKLLIEGVGYRYAVNGDKVKYFFCFGVSVSIFIPRLFSLSCAIFTSRFSGNVCTSFDKFL